MKNEMHTIYEIRSTASETERYFGITLTRRFSQRWNDHKNRPNWKLAAAFDKLGKDTFYIVAIASAKNVVDALAVEGYLERKYNTTIDGYGWNIQHGGSNGHSQETRAKISASLKASYASGKEPWNKGKECPEIAAKMLGNTNGVGHIMTDANKEQLSIRATGNNYGAANAGRTFKPETLAKMSAAKLGKPGNRPKGSITSDATKKKQSDAAKGRVPWNKGISTESRNNSITIKQGE